MKPSKALLFVAVAALVAAGMIGSLTRVGARQGGGSVRIDADDIGGIVTGPSGPEAGVWVIAETSDLPTRFTRIVVTDDQGRYLIPDLPQANYSVWVRGYGLVDSPKVPGTRGKALDLSAVPAPNARAAAEIYPAGWWYSLLEVPGKQEFPGTGSAGNGISAGLRSQAQWLRMVKSGACTTCHQMGTKGTREIPKELGAFESSVAAWERRIQSGQVGGVMSGLLNTFGRRRALGMFADWTDRIAGGEVPPAPPRPQGVERNVVITLWDWAGSEGVPARPGVNGSPQSAHQRGRASLRRAGGQRRLRSGAGSDSSYGDAYPGDSP